MVIKIRLNNSTLTDNEYSYFSAFFGPAPKGACHVFFHNSCNNILDSDFSVLLINNPFPNLPTGGGRGPNVNRYPIDLF